MAVPKKITITIDRKHIIFAIALVIWFCSAFGPLFKELRDAVVLYGEFDWWHIWTTHGTGIAGSTAAFWATMKAYGMVPEDVQQAVSALQEAAVIHAENQPSIPLETITEQTEAK